jgi:hypothetical protein
MINKSVLAAVAGLALSGVAATEASAITINDQYWGGLSVPAESNADIFGGDVYSVTSMDANRVGQDLTVTINTNYVNFIGDAGTYLGSLFIGSGPISYAGTGPEYKEDTYSGNPTRFSHVFDFDTANSSIFGGNGTGSLFTKGTVETSTVRLEQAVDSSGGQDTGINGTWSISAGSITFNISNFFATNIGIDTTSLILAWTMSCGNDVIIADGLDFGRPGSGQSSDVPLPAAAWFLLSGLAGMGYLKRRQSKQA